jgi:hypothetical protein
MIWYGEDYCKVMNKEWTPIAVARGDSLDSLFLNACRYLSLCEQQQPERRQYYMQLATRYKLSCMRALNEAISSEISALISDATLATVVMLGFDEVSEMLQCFFPPRTDFLIRSCSVTSLCVNAMR